MKKHIVFVMILLTLFLNVPACKGSGQEEYNGVPPPLAAMGAQGLQSDQAQEQPAPSQTTLVFPAFIKNLWARTNMTGLERCALPCWWGMMPGESRWEEFRNQFERAGYEPMVTGIDTETGFEKYSIDVLWFDQDRLWMYMNVFVDEADVIRKIEVLAGQFPRNELFMAWFSGYTPEAIMSTYGEPDEIYLSIQSKKGEPEAIYLIDLYYQQRNFSAMYMGATPIGDDLDLCPTFDEGGNLDSTVIFFEFRDSSNLQEVFSDADQKVLTLSEATGIRVSDLYDEFIRTEKIECLSTMLDIWVSDAP